MSDDVRDLLDRAAADSLHGIHLDPPTADDVARAAAQSPASVAEAEVIPLDHARRRGRWPLGLAAAILVVLVIGGGLLAVQSTHDPSPANPTTVPTGDARQRLLNAIDASVAEVFEADYPGDGDDRFQATGGGEAEIGRIWDGGLFGTYVKGTSGAPRVTLIGDDMATYYQTGPDRWVRTADGHQTNPLLEFRPIAERGCAVDRSGMIVVDMMPLDSRKPCGSPVAAEFGVTFDSAGRVASIEAVDSGDSVGMDEGGVTRVVSFEYSDVAGLELPDPSLVTERPNAVGTSVDPATGYWTVQDLDMSDVGPTTTLMSPP